MGFSIATLNNIRANASAEYQARIPEASQANIASIGQSFETYEVLYNEFHDALINKIGKTIIAGKLFKNKLAKFKTGGVTSPHDIEEIFVHMAKAEGAYDPDGKNPLGRRAQPDVNVAYHRESRRDKYVISLGDIDFVRVFRSEATLDAFISEKLNSVYSADAYDEWLAMKNTIATADYDEYEVPTLASASNKEEFAKSFVKTLRKAVNDCTFPSADHNKAGVLTWTEKASDLVLLVHKDVLVEVDVERLATAFHQSNTDMKVVPTIIAMDDFGSLGDTYGVLVEKDWFKIYDTKVHMEPIRNPDGLFTNYFFHHHQILSTSPFCNAIRFKAVSEA